MNIKTSLTEEESCRISRTDPGIKGPNGEGPFNKKIQVIQNGTNPYEQKEGDQRFRVHLFSFSFLTLEAPQACRLAPFIAEKATSKQ